MVMVEMVVLLLLLLVLLCTCLLALLRGYFHFSRNRYLLLQ